MASPSHMRTSFHYLLLTCSIALCLPAKAVTIAYWNFNELSIASAAAAGSGTVPTTMTASLGSGSIDLSQWAGTIDDFAGSSTQALNGDPAGASLSLIAGSGSPYPGNGSKITLQFSMLNRLNPILSFVTQGTATGFNSNQIAYSINGTDFTDFGSPYSSATSYSLQSFDLSTVDSLDNASSAYIRITFDGATGSTGNNRIDNLQISAIPEPSALALSASGLLLLTQRRRRS